MALAVFPSCAIRLPGKSKGKYLPRPLVSEQGKLLAQNQAPGYGPRLQHQRAGERSALRGWGRSPKPHIHHLGEPYPLCVQAAPDAAPAGYRVQDTGISSLPPLHCPSPSPNPNPTPHPWQKDALTLADGRVRLGHREKGQRAPCPLCRAG